MKQPLSYYLCTILVFLAVSNLNAQSLYWDANDVTAGAGATPTGTWDTDSFWSTDSTGQTTPATWVDGSTAIFSAGTDATTGFSVAITGSPVATGIIIEEGSVTNTGGTLNLTNAATINIASGSTNVISSTVVAGAVQITKSGGGVLSLGAANTQANTFTGGVIVGGGMLIFPGENATNFGGPNPLGTYPASAQVNHIIVSNNATLRSTKSGAAGSFVLANRGITLGNGGGNLEVTASAATDYLLYAGKVTGAGSLTKIGSGTLYLQSATDDYTGSTTNKAGFLGIGTSYPYSKGTMYLAGGGFTSFGASPIVTNAFTMTGNTTIRATSLLTSGSRTMIFSNIWNNTGGTMTIRNLGSASTIFSPRFFKGGWTFARPIVIGVASDSGVARLDIYNEPANGDLVFSGAISGPGAVRRSANADGGGGTCTFSGANTYSGGTSNNGGYLGFGSSSLPVGGTGAAVTNGPIGTGPLYINADPKVGFFASGSSQIVGNAIIFGDVMTNSWMGTNALEMSGPVTLNGLNLVFNVTNTSVTKFSGTIAGGGGTLAKRGAGKLVFSGDNSFPNNITVEAGSLFADNSTGSGTGSGSVTVNAGATLGGNGSISGAVSCLGNISPGDAVGTLTFNGGLDLSSGTCVWQLGTNDTTTGSADQIAVNGGSITLGGSSQLSINFTNTAAAPSATNSFWKSNHTWTVVSVGGSGSNPSLAGFATLQNATYSVGYFTNTVDGSGNVLLNYISTYVTPPSPKLSSTITGAGTTNAALSWSATNGALYQLQYKNDLNASNWLTIGTVTASGSTASFTDTNTPATNRFYRVIAP